MSSIPIDKIMQNIYGVNAEQTIKHITFTGGDCFKRPQAQLKYLDITKFNEITNTMSGGRKKRTTKPRRLYGGNKDITIYASPEYIGNKSLDKFLTTFFLYFRVSRSPASAIYIIPEESKLSEMVSAVDKLMSSKKFTPGSIEAQKEINMSKDLDFKRYLFTAYGNNTNDDKYRIDPVGNNKDAYPNSSFDTIRRVNLNSEVYYMSYVSPTEISISPSKKGDDSKKLKFVARAVNGVYIFTGSLPSKASEYSEPPKSVKVTVMKGGSRSNNKRLDIFRSFCERNQNIEDGSRSYVAYNLKHDPSIAKYLNGDTVYTAFAHAFEDVNQLSTEDKILDTIFDSTATIKNAKFTNQYTDSTKKALSKVIDNFKDYINNKQRKTKGYDDFIQRYNKLYKQSNIARTKADVATSLYRNGIDNFNDIVHICDEFESPNLDSEFHKSGRFAKLVTDAFVKYPVTSLTGSGIVPLFDNSDIEYNKKKKIHKKENSESDSEDLNMENEETDEEKKQKDKDKEITMEDDDDNEDKDKDIKNDLAELANFI